MVTIRLARGGSKKRPFYRVVAVDQRKKRDGRALAYLGTYDPRPSEEKLDLQQEAIESWVAKGAQMSDSVRTLLKRQTRQAAAAPGEA